MNQIAQTISNRIKRRVGAGAPTRNESRELLFREIQAFSLKIAPETISASGQLVDFQHDVVPYTIHSSIQLGEPIAKAVGVSFGSKGEFLAVCLPNPPSYEIEKGYRATASIKYPANPIRMVGCWTDY